MEIRAPATWRCVDFISDVHLQAAHGATFAAWRAYMQGTQADAVFILGDLFEVWVGDDVLNETTNFERACVAVLQAAAMRMPVFIMHGNRDFLMGPRLMQACGATALTDPTVLRFDKRAWLLSHGDHLCLEDTAYQVFRAQVRSEMWQTAFLAQPLQTRTAWALQLRAQSETLKKERGVYADVDTTAASLTLQNHQADTLLHGHTHSPGQHGLEGGRQRLVLSDWDLNATPPRAEVLRLHLNAQKSEAHPSVQRLSPAQACTDN